MRPPRGRVLAVTAALGVVLVVAVGLTRVTYEVNGVEVACPERVGSMAVKGLTDEPGDPFYACTVESQQRIFAVAAGLMGLVMISTFLIRRD